MALATGEGVPGSWDLGRGGQERLRVCKVCLIVFDDFLNIFERVMGGVVNYGEEYVCILCD